MTTFLHRAPMTAARGQQSILAANAGRRAHYLGRGQRAVRVFCVMAVSLLFLIPLPNRAGSSTIRIPFRTAQAMILVDGKVNGNCATLLLDTGSNRTIISARIYGDARFGFQELRQNSSRAGVSGGSISLRADLVLADHTWVAQRVSVMNLDELNDMLKLHFDGLLGQDILRQFRYVRIDYHTHTIELQE